MTLTKKSRETIDACRFCWMCRHICPIGNATGHERNNARARALSLSLVNRGAATLAEGVADNIYECALCGACTKECATGWDPVSFTKDVRLQMALDGMLPEYINHILDNLEHTGNPYGTTVMDSDLVKEIENESGADNIGIVVIFRADGGVKNPAIYHAESGEFTKVGYTDNDFTMSSGQYVIINTYTGKKNVYLLDGVTQAEIENHKDNYGVIDWDEVIEKCGTVINEYLDEDGDFIQLQDGTNTLTYSAEEGTNYLSVSVYYRISYLGV